MAKAKRQIEYRYYEMPAGHYVMALLGDEWVRNYKPDVEDVRHFHNYLEIGYCYYGDGMLTLEDDKVPYRDNVISIIPKNIPHATTTSTDDGIDKWEFLFIDIEKFVRNELTFKRLLPEEVIKRINRKAHLIHCSSNRQISNIVRCIIREYTEKNPHYKDCVEGYLRSLVIELVRLDENEDDRKILTDSRNSDYFKKSISFIEENYATDLKAEDIAMACGLSESHFRRIFEEAMSMKPMDYVNMVRIDKACELINSKDMSIEAVAMKVGFLIPSTFNRNFKRITGMTPYQWKKQARHMDGATANYKVSAKKGW